jgi:small subunit ribosomal protein S6
VESKGGEVVKAYELMLMLTPSLDEEARAAALEKVESLISSLGGTVDNVDSWGKRKLAFEIEDETEGDYVVVDLHTSPDSCAEIDRVLRITDSVVRFMLVRRDDRE